MEEYANVSDYGIMGKGKRKGTKSQEQSIAYS